MATEIEAAAPAKKRTRKSSEPVEVTETVLTADEAEVKPKRTRAKKAEPVAEVAASDDDAIVDEPVVEEKPKRTRAKKAEPVVVEAVTEEPVEAVDDEAPVKKTRKKAEPKTLAEIAGDAIIEEAIIEEIIAEEILAEEIAVVEAVIEAIEEEAAEQRVTFRDLGLSDSLLKSISAVGYEEPTPIQLATIPVLIDGADVIAQAQTGSGKTASFGLPIIERIDPKLRRVQAIILTPTRELAIQVSEALHKYGRHKEVETLPIYGGQPYERQFRGLQRGPQIVVGTPGRVMDHMRRGTLDLSDISFFVLDEADEMLDMGFIEDIMNALEQVPEDRRTALFSATMPPRIADLAARYLAEPDIRCQQADDGPRGHAGLLRGPAQPQDRCPYPRPRCGRPDPRHDLLPHQEHGRRARRGPDGPWLFGRDPAR